MAWVRSEYAGELAVVSAWISALLPWSVTVLQPSDAQFRFVVIRYAYFHLQFLLNLSLPGEETFLWLHEVHGFVADDVQLAILVAGGAAVALSLALALSVAYYAAEQRVEALPVDPVRLMGVFLGLAALTYAAATVLLWGDKAGLTVPIAPLFMAVFASALLRIERP